MARSTVKLEPLSEALDELEIAERKVDLLMVHLEGMTVSDLAELSKRLQLRLYRDGRRIVPRQHRPDRLI
jgi:hypothetical protein